MKNHSVLAVGMNTSRKEKDLIQKKLQKKNITLDIASIKDLLVKVVDGETSIEIKDRSLEEYDYVWIQSGWNTNHMAYILHLYLEKKEIPHNKINVQSTKLSDILRLSSQNVLVPNTYFHNGLKIDSENISEIENLCKLPCIYKTSLGSLGDNVYLIDNIEDIKKTIKRCGKYNRYIFQEYIPNEFDYRIVISNNEPISICKRTRVSDKFRNNVALGATEDFFDAVDVCEDVLATALHSAKALNLNWAGVDIVTDNRTGKNYVLEVNRRPGLTENSTETFAAFNYIQTVVNTL